MHTILVVEDDPATLAMYRAGLEDAGLRVLDASTAEDALRLARAQLPQLVVADLLLGASSGVELCHALRSDPLLRHIPIVVVTGMPGEAARGAVRNAGANAVL